jgi:hypothetical protein
LAATSVASSAFVPAPVTAREQPSATVDQPMSTGHWPVASASETVALVDRPALTDAKQPAAEVSALCGPVAPGYSRCFALERTDVAAASAAAVGPNYIPSGYGPADLASAYSLPGGNAGAGLTVAVVDAYDAPNAEADLAIYRAQYGLPACTTANGCFHKINQNGGTTYPAYDAGWAGEIALDLDMVSATCPKCKILLVEATTAYDSDLGAAVDQAVAQGAVAVSNSYGGPEWSGETAYDSHFNHPGVAITASTGDCGYRCAGDYYDGVQYPAASPNVVAVGGTKLVRDGSSRGWTESVWSNQGNHSGTGSGCSVYEPKPSWQTDVVCTNRIEADVSAVADPETGVAVYNSAGGGWAVYGGTSASSPIIASVYALAGTPGSGTYPASYLYFQAYGLNDVTVGNNNIWGDCTWVYYCTGGSGYDGPTGLGTPNGVASFRQPWKLQGKVTGALGGSLSGVTVTAASGSRAVNGVTGADGSFTLMVPPETYIVSFVDPDGLYQAGFYASSGFTTSRGSATPVIVGNADVGGVNVQMSLAPQTSTTFFRMVGTITHYDTRPAANFRVGHDGSHVQFEVWDSSSYWDLDLAAPIGQPLVPGVYSNTARHPFEAAGQPGLDLAIGSSGCNTVTGSFAVLTAVYDASGKVLRFHAVFSMYCEGVPPEWKGEISYVAASYLNLTPAGATVNPGTSQAYHAEGFDLDGLDFGDVTADTTFTMDGQSCVTAGCRPLSTGDRSIVGSYGGATGTTTLHVVTASTNIRGTVTAPGGAGLAGIAVQAVSPYLALSAVTDANGHYAIAAGPGSYAIAFSDSSGTYTSGYYVAGGGTTPYLASATTVTMAASDVARIDLVLPLAVLPNSSFLSLTATTGDLSACGSSGSARGPGGYSNSSLSHIHFQGSGLGAGGGWHTWYITVDAPAGQKLLPGVYPYAVNYPSGPTQAGLGLTVDFSSCGVYGSFTIVSAVYDTDGTLLKFHGYFSTGELMAEISTVAWPSSIVVSPAEATVPAGVEQAYHTEAFAASGRDYGDITGDTWFGIDGVKCNGNLCSSTVVGDHAITAEADTKSSTATLHVTNLIVSGTVSNGSSGIGGILVELIRSSDGKHCGEAVTLGNGTWPIKAGPGTYKLYFHDPNGVYASGYLGNGVFTYDPSAAKTIVVDTVDLQEDILLPPAIHISGTVTNSGSQGLDGLNVAAVDAASGTTTSATVAVGGFYSLAVSPGNYQVRVTDPAGTYPSGYWRSGGFTQDIAQAGLVAVTSGDRSGINLVIPDGFRISGTLTEGSGGVGGIKVDIRAAGSVLDDETTTGSGAFSAVMVPGVYTISFTDPSGIYGAGYWSGTGFTADPALAASVSAATSGINVSLPLALGKPLNVSAVPHDRSAVVSWSAPAHDGGGTISRYSVTSNPDGQTCVWTSGQLSCTVSNLSNGRAYTFTVVATNPGGDGPASDPSSGITPVSPATPPSKPTGVVAVAGNTTATVSWSAPSSNGGAAIFSYQVTSAPDGKTCTWSGGPYTCQVLGLVNGRRYTFTVTATSTGGTSQPSDPSASVVFLSGATYHAVTPYRVLDSRVNKGGWRFSSQVKQTIWMAAPGSGVPSDAVAVTGNVTLVDQTFRGYVSLAPYLTSYVTPGTSTINVPEGDIRANGVTVPLAAGGNLDFMYWATDRGATTSVIFDVTGYFAAGEGATYHAVTPYRVLDSRVNKGGSRFTSQVEQTVTIATSASGVPADAVAVTGNVTVVDQTFRGYVSVAPSLTTRVVPGTSTINVPEGDIRANGVTVPLAAGGNLDFMYWATDSGATASVIFDVTGYFAAGEGATYHVVTPYRVLDSRVNKGGSRFASQIKQTVAMSTSQSGVPADAVAATGNVTLVDQTFRGYVSLAPNLANWVVPGTSTINVPEGDIRANGVTVPLAAGGYLDFMYWATDSGASTSVIFDVTGYFAAG